MSRGQPRRLREGNPFDIRHIFRGDAVRLSLPWPSTHGASTTPPFGCGPPAWRRCSRGACGRSSARIHSLRAISALDSPSSTHRITSRSRGVNMPSQEGRSAEQQGRAGPRRSTTSVEPSLAITSVPHALACQSAIRSGSRATGHLEVVPQDRSTVSDAISLLLVPSRRRVPLRLRLVQRRQRRSQASANGRMLHRPVEDRYDQECLRDDLRRIHRGLLVPGVPSRLMVEP